jgi:choline dehydrogenase-like flavoprotein
VSALPEISTDVVVIGSGAGGAVTAATLAERGRDVLVLEEGPDVATGKLVSNSSEAMRLLYRDGGMTPILGSRNIAFVEGRCVGGSTKINSAFWHRLPADSYHRWRADADLDGFSAEEMAPYFERVERALSVSLSGGRGIPESSLAFRRGAEILGWECAEVPRCQKPDPGTSPFAPGGKQSMQRTYLPAARAAGARILADCTAARIVHRRGRARALRASLREDGRPRTITIRAEAFFVCCGPIQTPVLLRRSGIRRNVGDNLCIHPMIKAAAIFRAELDAADAGLPIYQVREFGPNITLGGAVFTPGFLAMTLAASWEANAPLMGEWRRMALYYAATRGMKRGSVRVAPGGGALVRYPLSRADRRNLGTGLARLSQLLLAGGATAVHPGVRAPASLRSSAEALALLERPPPLAAMDLSTVHAFSTCPMGENPDLCATDSFGRLRDFENLYVNDASLIPDSPGVNPQGTTMAIALRNAERFASET